MSTIARFNLISERLMRRIQILMVTLQRPQAPCQTRKTRQILERRVKTPHRIKI